MVPFYLIGGETEAQREGVPAGQDCLQSAETLFVNILKLFRFCQWLRSKGQELLSLRLDIDLWAFGHPQASMSLLRTRERILSLIHFLLGLRRRWGLLSCHTELALPNPAPGRLWLSR